MELMLGVAKFDGARRAEQMLAAHETLHPHTDWSSEVGVVRRGRLGRISAHGNFGEGFFGGEENVSPLAGLGMGGLTGMLAGALAGPAGMLVGSSLGAAVGGVLGVAHELDKQPLFELVRSKLGNDSSALMLFADPPHVKAFLAAFGSAATEVLERRLREDLGDRVEAAVLDECARYGIPEGGAPAH